MKLFRRILFWSHLGTGVVAGAIILALAFTGVLLTYERQIVAASEAGLVELTDQPHLTADELARIARELGGDDAEVLIPKRDKAPIKVYSQGDQILVHPQSGKVLLVGNSDVGKSFEYITHVHRWLAFNGNYSDFGKSATGFANLAFVFLAISGIYLWCTPIFRWVVLKTKLRLSLNPPTGKARDFNWHHVFGFWMFVPILVMSVTGAVISYAWANSLVFALFEEEPQSLQWETTSFIERLPPDLPSEFATIEERIEAASSSVGSWNTILFSISEDLAEPTRFEIDAGNGAQLHLYWHTTVGPNGVVLEEIRPFQQNSAGTRARLVIRFLHTGEILGLIGQTLAGLGSLATLILVWSGLALSYRRLVRPALRRRNQSI